MDSKNKNEYRKNKKINKNKRYEDQKKKNTFLNEDPDDNYNELTYGHFDKKQEENEEKEDINKNDLYEEKNTTEEKESIKLKEEIIIEEEFTEDYFEPVVYTKK